MSKQSESTINKELTLKDIDEHLDRIEVHVKQIKKNAKAQGVSGMGFKGMAAGMALVATGVYTTGGLLIFVAGFIAVFISFYFMSNSSF